MDSDNADRDQLNRGRGGGWRADDAVPGGTEPEAFLPRVSGPVTAATDAPEPIVYDDPSYAHIVGTVERVRYEKPEDNFYIFLVKVKGNRNLVTVIGNAASLTPGHHVEVSGVWKRDYTWGMQLLAKYLRVTAPTSLEGIQKYLGSGVIRGIGPGCAARLVGALGEAVFDVVERQPERLLEIDGIGKGRQQKILDGWAEQKAIQKIMLFLHAHGVATSHALRIYKTYGDRAEQIVTENPYRLARDIYRIGFKTADAIAQRLGIGLTSMIRARAGISYALSEAMKDGHCALPVDRLLAKAEKLLEIPLETIGEALTLELDDEIVVGDSINGHECVFLPHLHRAEREIAERLLGLMAQPVPWPVIDIGKAIPWVAARLSAPLTDGQKEAVAALVREKVLVVTGNPGVGKTTLVRSIMMILRAKGMKILLCAPTGKAADRLQESTGAEAMTIHRMLGVHPELPGFLHGPDNPLDCDLLIVDETSMVDVSLMLGLLRALPPRAALLLVGDADQLPSVGPGQVLADILRAGVVPVARLTEIMRQAKDSRIIMNALRVNSGRLPGLETADCDTHDFFFLAEDDPDKLARKIVFLVSRKLPERFGFDPSDIQVLTPRKGGVTGVEALNLRLQEALNPAREGASKVRRFGWEFGVGDPVVQLENDYDKEVYNGDMGRIVRHLRDERSFVIAFDAREVVYAYDEMDRLMLAYALSVHKAQGSEFDVVIIPIHSQHGLMLERSLLFTAMTRGRKMVILIGERAAVRQAVRRKRKDWRWTKLAEWLRELAQGREAAEERDGEPVSPQPAPRA